MIIIIFDDLAVQKTFFPLSGCLERLQEPPVCITGDPVGITTLFTEISTPVLRCFCKLSAKVDLALPMDYLPTTTLTHLDLENDSYHSYSPMK